MWIGYRLWWYSGGLGCDPAEGCGAPIVAAALINTHNVYYVK